MAEYLPGVDKQDFNLQKQLFGKLFHILYNERSTNFALKK
jgi:hypothetical protein